MTLLKKISLFLVTLLFSTVTTYALTLEWDINLDSATSDSLNISWQPVDWAVWYFVYYDSVSHVDDKKYKSLDDMIDSTWATIPNLQPDTTYYVAIRVVDWEWNEGDYSKEYSFKTEMGKKLSIENINVIDSKDLSVWFNVAIDDTKDKEFKITEKDNNLVEVWINSLIVDGGNVLVKLSDPLESNKTYTLTVVSLTWVNWETIDAWVDGVIDFDSGDLSSSTQTWSSDTYSAEATPDLNSASDNSTNTWTTQTWTELNSASTEQSQTWITLSWTELSNSQIKKTAELASAKVKKLPKTGPTEWLLLIVALIIWFIVVKFRKQA